MIYVTIDLVQGGRYSCRPGEWWALGESGPGNFKFDVKDYEVTSETSKNNEINIILICNKIITPMNIKPDEKGHLPVFEM